MNTIEIPDRNLTVEIASHWDEMTGRQVFYCLSTILSMGSKPVEEQLLQIKIRCFYNIADIRRSWKSILLEKIMPADWTLEKNAKIATLAKQLTSFLFSPDGGLNYNTILNHFPSPKTRGLIPKTLYGPADILADLTFGEFRAAIEEMNDYFELSPLLGDERGEKSDHQLSRFIATLYRPERKHYHRLVKSETFDGQRREPFNRNRIEANARLAGHLHPVHRTAILLWFTYCINYIQTEDIIISGRTINLKALFPKRRHPEPVEGSAGSGGSGWTSILYHIAKEGIFGNAEATDKAGLFDVLLYMYDQDAENKRLKAKYGKKK